jgi:hypothetical protein
LLWFTAVAEYVWKICGFCRGLPTVPNQPCLNGRVPPDDHAQGQDKPVTPKPTSENQPTGDATHPPTPPAAPLPRPIAPTIYDLLNTRIEERLLGAKLNRQQGLLTGIGGALRRWRIRGGYTREMLAIRLGCTVAEILTLESGLTSTSKPLPDGHVDPNEALLRALLDQAELDNTLRMQIREYLNPSR